MKYNLKDLLKEKIVDKENVRNYVLNNARKEAVSMKKNLALVVSGILMILVVVAGIYKITNNNVMVGDNKNLNNESLNNKKIYYATIDINPSVELALDENDKVVDVIPLNDDAIIAYEGLDLIGQDLIVATDEIIGTAIELGYINELNEDNKITVTTYTDSDNEEVNGALTTKIEEAIDITLIKNNLSAVIYKVGVTDEIKEKALEYNVPIGKVLLVQRAIALDSSLIESDLVNMSISDIQSKIKENAIEKKQELKTMYQNQNQELEQVKNQIKEEAKIKIENKKQELMNTNNSSGKNLEELVEEEKEEVKKIIQEKNTQLNKVETQTQIQPQTQTQNQPTNQTQQQNQTTTQTQIETQTQTQTETQNQTKNGTTIQTQTQTGKNN
jgi:hypothetical protein